MAPKKRWSIHELTELDDADFAQFPDKLRKDIIKQMQKQVQRRMKELEKKISGTDHFSPSLEAAKKMFEAEPMVNADAIEKSEKKFANLLSPLRKEFSRLQRVLQHETSTYAGTLKWERAQDRMLFGVNSKGKAKGTMTGEERRAFWSAVNEYRNQKPATAERFGSNRLFENVALVFEREGAVKMINMAETDRAGLINLLDRALLNIEGESNVPVSTSRGHGKPGRFHK